MDTERRVIVADLVGSLRDEVREASYAESNDLLIARLRTLATDIKSESYTAADASEILDGFVDLVAARLPRGSLPSFRNLLDEDAPAEWGGNVDAENATLNDDTEPEDSEAPNFDYALFQVRQYAMNWELEFYRMINETMAISGSGPWMPRAETIGKIALIIEDFLEGRS
jgi:hypothetical protein